MSLTITRATKIVPLVVNMALQAEHERAVLALDEARNRAAQDPRETSTDVRDAALAVQAIEQQMKEHTVLFTLQALPRKVWTEYETNHPPRKGNPFDETVGCDTSALDEVIVLAVIDVKDGAGNKVPFVPATDWVPLADEMSDAQWTTFAKAMLNLNNGATAAPFSPAASREIRLSEQTSKRQNDSD